MPKQKPKETGIKRKQFTYTTTEGTAIALVFDYLHARLDGGFSYREGKERAADAMLAFWKPYAAEASGEYSQADLQEMARSSVEVLTRQIRNICQDFEVENPPTQSRMSSDGVGKDEVQGAIALWECLANVPKLHDLVILLQGQHQSIDDLGDKPHAEYASKTSSAANEENGVYVNDDELLGDYAA